MDSSNSLLADDKQLLNKEGYKLYPYRFVIMLLYILTTNQNLIMFCLFIPIQNHLVYAYGESLNWISFGTIMISNVAYIPANFVGNYIVDTFGLRVGLNTGMILNVIGLWIRILCSRSFFWIFLGQCFGGIAQPFFYSTPQKISNVWFGPKERAYATTLMAASMTFSYAIGAIIPQFFMDLDHDPTTQDRSEIKNQVYKMMLLTAYMGSICLIFTVILMKTKPKTPPSKGAEIEKYPVSKSWKVLLKDWNALSLIIASAVVNGGAVIYISTINQVTAPFGITSDQVSNMVSLSTLLGLIGFAIGAEMTKKNTRFNLVIIGTSVLSLLVLIGNLFLLNNVYLFGAAFIVYNIFQAPIQPVALEYAVELSFPIAEATVGGLWFVANQLFSTFGVFGVNAILGPSESPPPENAKMTFYVIIGIQVISTIPLLFVRENLKRARYEGSVGAGTGIGAGEKAFDNKASLTGGEDE